MTTDTLPALAAYAASVKPAKRGRSDKFSWRLYRFLSCFHGAFPQVYAHQINRADNKSFRPFDKATARPSELFIGRLDADGWASGSYVCDILNTSYPLAGYAFAPRFFVHAVDVSDWFWPEYQRIGRCIWDPGHVGFMEGTESRFELSPGGKARVCLWCGQRQKLVTRVRRIRERNWEQEARA